MRRRIGIDLGTTNCCLAWTEGGTPVVYESEVNHRTIPSVVAQDRDGQVTVGWDARVRRDPLYRYGFAKRHFGLNQQYPMLDGPVHPYVISHYLLKDLKQRAEAALNADVEAVITVPAHFHENQKRETRLAAERAALGVVDLLAEPVAAAYAYYHGNPEAGHGEIVLVFDLGGGTMDATVCIKEGERIEVAAARTAYAGDRYLGGLDFDKALVMLAAAPLGKQGFRLGSLGEDLPSSPWLWTLLLSAEDCKHQLSRSPTCEWAIELVDGERRAKLDLRITRPTFEQAIAADVAKALEISDRAIRTFAASLPDGRALGDQPDKQLALGLSRLSRILLVGGSTLVPLVQRRVEEHYRVADTKIPVEKFRPFEAVAIGAALYAESRPASGSGARGGAIEWLAPLDDTVAGDQAEIHEIVGRLAAAPDASSTITLTVGGKSYSANVTEGGTFRLQRVALAPGANRLVFAWADRSGRRIGEHHHDVRRGGMGFSPVGLGRAIGVRTVQGTETLIEAGTPADTPYQAKRFFLGDESGSIRLPLFEGFYPIGSVEFAVSGAIGTPVLLRASYSGKGLTVAARVGTGPEIEQPLKFEPTVYVASRGPLWERYQKLKNEAAALIRALPEWVPLSQHLADSFKAVTIDLETEFANPLILDPARIEDRLKQLQSVMWTAQAFPTTRDGFTHSIEDLRQRVVRNGGDDDLLAMLDELRAEVPDHPSSEAIVSLSVRLDGIAALVNRRHPFAVTEDFRNHLEQTIQVQVDSLRRYGGDPAVITEAEKSLKAIAEDRSAPLSQRCSKLYSLSVEVNSVYRKVVSARENRGLLSSTPV